MVANAALNRKVNNFATDYSAAAGAPPGFPAASNAPTRLNTTFTDLIGHIFEVGLVSLRQEDSRDASAVRRQALLLDTADLEDIASQRDLAAHRDIWPHFELCEHRRQRHVQRHARRRAIFRNRSRWQVHVNVGVTDEVFGEPELCGAGPHECECRRGGLLQDVTHVAGEVELACTRHAGGLDEQQIAPGRGPRQAGRDAGLRASLRFLTLGRRIRQDRHVLSVCDAHGDGTAHGCRLLLELSDARFMRVGVDHQVDGLV